MDLLEKLRQVQQEKQALLLIHETLEAQQSPRHRGRNTSA
jgi:hypothetical protein